jgi:hypothetical protein
VSFYERRLPRRCQPCPFRPPSVSTLRFGCSRRSPLLTIVNDRTPGSGLRSTTEKHYNPCPPCPPCEFLFAFLLTYGQRAAKRDASPHDLRVSPIRPHADTPTPHPLWLRLRRAVFFLRVYPGACPIPCAKLQFVPRKPGIITCPNPPRLLRKRNASSCPPILLNLCRKP